MKLLPYCTPQPAYELCFGGKRTALPSLCPSSCMLHVKGKSRKTLSLSCFVCREWDQSRVYSVFLPLLHDCLQIRSNPAWRKDPLEKLCSILTHSVGGVGKRSFAELHLKRDCHLESGCTCAVAWTHLNWRFTEGLRRRKELAPRA